jgi:oligopeptide transport system substrate-binding protein
MKPTRLELPDPHSRALARFTELVDQSVPRFSRRDALRAAAVVAASSATPILSPATRAVAAARRQGSGNREVVVPFHPFGQPVILDPHRAQNWGPFWVLFPHVWAGLLAFDENGSVVTDIAESVEPNEAADVWKCTIREGITFQSGNPVNAEACIASWKRALDPEQPAPMASFMSQVKGFDAYLTGESADIGFTAVDERTVEITLEAPYSSFPASLATFVWAVVDVNSASDSTPESPAGAPAGAGAWKITEFVDGERIVMEPNPASPDAGGSSISRLVWRIFDGPEAHQAALDAYRADEIAIADVPGSVYEAVASDEALSQELITIESSSSTMAIGMDFNQEPFNDVRVRQALAASIDRERWATEVWAGEFQPAVGCVPPVVTLTSGYEPVAPLPFNPDAAKDLLERAQFDPADSSTEVVHYQPADDPVATIDRHAQLLALIEEASGIAIRHDTSLSREQVEALRTDNQGSQFDIVWWWTVTDTPAILGTIGRSDSANMAGRFNWSPEESDTVAAEVSESSAAFDAHIDDANAAIDPEARNAAYREAETLLIDNAVYIPLGHWVQRFLQKPWLKGTRQGAWTGSIPVRFDADVTTEEDA